VGAAIFNHHAKPVAALSVAGPAVRIKKGRIKQLGPLVRNTANSISERLGA
jgi:IclR family acetate operon transcriptional repressor